MKVYTERSDRQLCDELNEVIKNIRKKRDFNPERYIKEKTDLLNAYMKKCNLDACVVAVSGGIDSAITLGLVMRAMEKSDIIKIVKPLLLPCNNNTGVVGQSEATNRGIELCHSLNIEPVVIEMCPISGVIKENVDRLIGIKGEDWATGQLVPYSRTPVLYYTTSLLSQDGHGAVICGTTNLDEGGYLGYVGKASDGIVDVQLISDIHKSEVYQVARQLNIPDSILKVTPTGDMYDSRVDEEVFGAPYDFVEFYLNYLNMPVAKRQETLNSFSIYAMNQFEFYKNNLETLHKYNSHKYFSKSPAVHLDLYDSGIEGGWDNYRDVLKLIFN